MRTASVAFLLSLLTSAVLTPVMRHLAHRFGVLDQALSSRKIHKNAVPRLGGTAIVCAFFAPLVALFCVDSGVGRTFVADAALAHGVFLGGTLIAALGLYDDLRGAGAKTKFAVQFAVAGLMYALGFRIDQIANPFGSPLPLGWLGLPFTLLWIAGIINAINLIDGLDGLAGGVALVKVTITLVFALLHGDPLMILIAAALSGAILGFLFYNFNPATIFMGDTGSMFLGFVLASSAIHSHQKSSTAIAILIPIVALGFPIADTLLAMGRRAMRGAPLFQADRGHIHHRLLAMGLNQRQTTFVLWGVSAALGVIAVALAYATPLQAAALLLLLGALMFFRLRRLGFLQFERAGEVLKVRRRNLERRAALHGVAEQIKRAAGVDDVFESLQAMVPALGADCVCMRFEQARPYARPKRFACGTLCSSPREDIFCARYPLRSERPEANRLKLGWSGGPVVVDRDTEIAVDILCDHLRNALSRIENDGLNRPAANEELSVETIDAAERESEARGKVVALRR